MAGSRRHAVVTGFLFRLLLVLLWKTRPCLSVASSAAQSLFSKPSAWYRVNSLVVPFTSLAEIIILKIIQKYTQGVSEVTWEACRGSEVKKPCQTATARPFTAHSCTFARKNNTRDNKTREQGGWDCPGLTSSEGVGGALLQVPVRTRRVQPARPADRPPKTTNTTSKTDTDQNSPSK